jgi:hypothetical protein
MRPTWTWTVLRIERGLMGLLMVAAFGMIVWRHRQNRFLFFGWAAVAVALCLLYAFLLKGVP